MSSFSSFTRLATKGGKVIRAFAALAVAGAAVLASLTPTQLALASLAQPAPTGSTQAAPTPSNFQCPDAGVFNELVGGVCWSSMFPIMISGEPLPLGNNDVVPNGAVKNQPSCYCAGNSKTGELPRLGIPIGYWQPSLLIEVVPHPYCMPALGGVYPGGTGSGLMFSGGIGGHDSDLPKDGEQQANFWNVHEWSFPLVSMLNMLNVPNCGTGYNGMNLMNMSEVQPQWNDDLTAELLWPESSVLAGPVGTFGAVGECLKELPPGSQPINDMYWTAGCWGLLFPPDGNTTSDPDPIQDSNLEAARFLSTEYRLGFGVQTMGSASMCGPKYAQIMPKTQFRYQLVYPNDETTSVANKSSGAAPAPLPASSPQTSMPYSTDNANTVLSPAQTNSQLGSILNAGVCTHWTGQTPLEWGEWLGQPGTGDNYVYIVFQWTDCCMGIIGGSL